jgi:hypothetical protein
MKITASWKLASILEGQAMFGGHEVAPKMTPIELLMAGDVPLCNVAIGKEGFLTWWCCLCKLLKKDWQRAGHERGEPWTIEKLTEHSQKVEDQEINTKDAHAVCGVKGGGVIFDAAPLSHFVTPVLRSLAKATVSWTTTHPSHEPQQKAAPQSVA